MMVRTIAALLKSNNFKYKYKNVYQRAKVTDNVVMYTDGKVTHKLLR